MNMIEQDLLIENRRGLDKIARREYERNAQLGVDERTADEHIVPVVRGRLEHLLAALKHVRTARTQPVPR